MKETENKTGLFFFQSSNIFLYLLFVLYGCHTYSQPTTNSGSEIFTSTKNLKAKELYVQANDQFIVGKLNDALFLLNKALAIDSNYIDAYMRLGSIYHRQNDSINEEIQYLKVISINPEFSIPYYNLGQLLMKKREYGKAKEMYKKFLYYDNTSAKFQQNATKFLSVCEFRENAMKHPVPFNPVNLGEGVNSADDEYWPVLTADEKLLFFTRRSIADPTKNLMQGGYNEDIYFSNFLNNQWDKSKSVAGDVNRREFNEGAISISPDGKELFFTICSEDKNVGYGVCDIYVTEYKNGYWQTPKNLGPPINTIYKETQPSISFDGKTLYFSSNRKGTIGQLDLWRSTRNTDGTWTDPVNLGTEVNTPGSEQSPFIHPDDQTLYFSSDYSIGMGGADLYYAKKDAKGNFTNVKPLGYPINSHENEISIFVSSSGDKAYLASIRDDGFGKYDIYSFILPKMYRPEPVCYLKGVVYDVETKAKLSARFELVDLETGKLVKEAWSEPGTGAFLVTIPANTDFALNVDKEGYLFYSANLPLKGSKSTSHEKDVPLLPLKVGQKIVLNNIFFDFDKTELLPKSKTELEKVIALMNKYPNMKLELGGHTDNYGTDEYNNTLSNNRAKAVYDYLINIGGISSDRLTYKGYGESQPITTNETDEGRAMNRRTELKITAM